MKVTIDFRKLNDFQDRLKTNIYKKAVRAGAKMAVADMRTSVAVRYGALKKSIGSKVDSPKGGLVSYAVIGPRSGYVYRSKGRIEKPSRYAHFTLKVKDFLGSVYSQSNKYLRAIIDSLATEIDKGK